MAPRHASAWNGYGFLNYRACQAYGSEIIYGAYYAAGEVESLLRVSRGRVASSGTRFPRQPRMGRNTSPERLSGTRVIHWPTVHGNSVLCLYIQS